mmetsp:Transcript_31357/g.52907  ORF Transcript_31357/g.52907 Transcript_31357/m.52907 type:complete len:284 (-) Transcript_31357:1467-2318(-)
MFSKLAPQRRCRDIENRLTLFVQCIQIAPFLPQIHSNVFVSSSHCDMNGSIFRRWNWDVQATIAIDLYKHNHDTQLVFLNGQMNCMLPSTTVQKQFRILQSVLTGQPVGEVVIWGVAASGMVEQGAQFLVGIYLSHHAWIPSHCLFDIFSRRSIQLSPDWDVVQHFHYSPPTLEHGCIVSPPHGAAAIPKFFTHERIHTAARVVEKNALFYFRRHQIKGILNSPRYNVSKMIELGNNTVSWCQSSSSSGRRRRGRGRSRGRRSLQQRSHLLQRSYLACLDREQ